MRHRVIDSPYSCRWCGTREEHGRSWVPSKDIHSWERPTNAQILARMKARRNARLNPAPAVYHATTAWAAGHTGEEGVPYCADCKTDACRPWMRIQARLDEHRWGIPRNQRHQTPGEPPW